MLAYEWPMFIYILSATDVATECSSMDSCAFANFKYSNMQSYCNEFFNNQWAAECVLVAFARSPFIFAFNIHTHFTYTFIYLYIYTYTYIPHYMQRVHCIHTQRWTLEHNLNNIQEKRNMTNR